LHCSLSLSVMLELENQVIITEDVIFLDLMSVIEAIFKTMRMRKIKCCVFCSVFSVFHQSLPNSFSEFLSMS
jgi:hypothetical protein